MWRRRKRLATEKRNKRTRRLSKIRKTPRKASAKLVLYIGYIFRRYIVTVGRLICNLHRKVNISDKRDLPLCTFRILLLLLYTPHNMMYYNDNAVWPRFLKFLRYSISYTYMNSERGILRRYKYVALFRIIYQRRVTVYSFINPLLLFSLYYIVSFDDREN